MMPFFRTILFIYALVLCHSPVFAEIFQWTDSNGAAHFSDSPTNVPKGNKPIVRQDEIDDKPLQYSQQLSTRVLPIDTTERAIRQRILRSRNEWPVVDANEVVRIKSVWQIVLNAILNGQTQTAKNHIIFTSPRQVKAINDNKIADKFSGIEDLLVFEIIGDEINGDVAHTFAIKSGDILYSINFRKDKNRVWKMEGFYD